MKTTSSIRSRGRFSRVLHRNRLIQSLFASLVLFALMASGQELVTLDLSESGLVSDGPTPLSEANVANIASPYRNAGVTFEVKITPSAEDLSGTVMVMEVGGSQNGLGLYLRDGVPLLLLKSGASGPSEPVAYIPGVSNDASFLDHLDGTSTDDRSVAIEHGVGVLPEGVPSTLAISYTPDRAGADLYFAVAVNSGAAGEGSSAGAEVESYDILGNAGEDPLNNWHGNLGLGIGNQNDGRGGSVAQPGHVLSEGDVTDFTGSVSHGFYWNRYVDLSVQQICSELDPSVADQTVGDQFGVALAMDGDTLVVGTPGRDGLTGKEGSVFIYVRDEAGAWSKQAKLVPFDAVGGAEFGASVAIFDNIVVVGAPKQKRVFDSGESVDFAGAVYVFGRSGTSWSQLAKLVPFSNYGTDRFGASVAVLYKSGMLLVAAGAPNALDGLFVGKGIAYVFSTEDLATWFQFEIRPQPGQLGTKVGSFGASVALAGGPSLGAVPLLLVGAPGDNDAGGFSGSAHIYSVSSSGLPSFVGELIPGDAAASAEFGHSIAASGTTAVIGAPGDDDNGYRSGAAYVFDLTDFSLEAKLIGPSYATSTNFGISVDLDEDRLVVGSPNESVGNVLTGSAHYFARSGSEWTQVAQMIDCDAQASDHAGRSVALSGDTAAVGEPGRSTDFVPIGSGKLRVFDLPDPSGTGVNLAPTAVAGDDQSVRLPDFVVNLDGSASYDDNTPSESLNYSWTLISGSGVLLDQNTATPTLWVATEGTYVVELVVTDEEGLSSAPDQVIISSDNLAPTAVATVDYSLAIIGETVTFDGSESSDPEGDAIDYLWDLTAAPSGSTASLVGETTVSPTLTPDLEGQYDVSLWVSDFLGSGTPVTVSVLAVSPTDYAEVKVINTSDLVDGLLPGEVTTLGNQEAFSNFLINAIKELQKDNVAEAIVMLNLALQRTDGCVLRGAPDGSGPGRDWITDCDQQKVIYHLIREAIEALED